MKNKLIIFGIILSLNIQNAYALLGTYGTRPLGMGGAFTAVADDANAAYWNPAGLALNPEVSITASTKLNNRNTYVGDNIGNLKLSYQTEMNPFEWIFGVGTFSMLALDAASYLSESGILKKGWGRAGQATAREESMASQVNGTEETTSLKKELKETAKEIARAALSEGKKIGKELIKESIQAAKEYTLMPLTVPWRQSSSHRPYYWEYNVSQGATSKAQFALGISWLNDNNSTASVNQNTNWYTLSLASGFSQRVSIGTNFNFYNLEKVSTGIKGIGMDMDIGTIIKPVDYLSFGLIAKGIATTDIKWQDNSLTRYEMQVNAGVAIKPTYALTLAADMHNVLQQYNQSPTYHYGAEAVLLPGILGRAGVSDGNKTAGLSLSVENLILDYAILGGTYNRTQMAGLSWRF